MSFWEYKPYVSVAEKKKKANRKLAKLRKKNPNIQPVRVEGRKLATTWWGKAWNQNLESYADYSNRIGRGRSYVRNNAILDLQITKGSIEALVQGSSTYNVKIAIQPLAEKKWQKIQKACQQKLDSLPSLLAGNFSKDLAEVFTGDNGLFPTPKEISFDCDCPDWASMCKHVAATLYGIGTRLDSDPQLFFVLRDVEMKELVSKVVAGKKLSLLEKARQKSSRVIDDSNLSSLFGIAVDRKVVMKPDPKKTLKATKNKRSKKKSTPSKAVSEKSISLSKKQKPHIAKNVSQNLKPSQQKILDLLSKQGSCSASDAEFARLAGVGKTYLRVILEELVTLELVTKKKKAAKFRYQCKN